MHKDMIKMQLQIRHFENSSLDDPQFEVVRDGKHDKPVSITSPDKIIVGTNNETLQGGLQWYLESYMEMPIGGNQTRAKNIQQALGQWGKDTFKALFGSEKANNWFEEARLTGLQSLEIKIASDSPTILSWPWEALECEDNGCLALQCRMERQLCNIPDSLPPADALPKDSLNILYIIARPSGENDVGFQTLIRPLIDFAFTKNISWPVNIDVLRPPTFEQLLAVLREKPNFYHIVHFDGHGSYDGHECGVLIFEKEKEDCGEGDPISAKKLSELLREHNIPIMILNACQSAMQAKYAGDPFASVAASLIKAGVYSVVAMSYNLWVSGAKEFVPKFYERLFEDGNIAEAMRLGRQKMYRNNMRNSIVGEAEFNDWIVPILYQQLPSCNNVLPKLKPHEVEPSKLPDEILDIDDYGFIGREREIFKLERAIQRQPQAGILIHGISGEGKTTLVKGFLQWLNNTKGLGRGAFWFSFENIHSANYIIDTLVSVFFGIQARMLPEEEKFTAVVKKLKVERFFLLWDNFESASGIEGSEVSAKISENGRKLLKRFLYELRNGKTKVLITSRSREEWLSLQECFCLPLSGLQGEELWQYCNAVVADLGLSLDRTNEDYQNLLKKLHGNPLAIRAILLRLGEKPAKALLAEFNENFKGLEGDDSTNRIQAVLSVFKSGLDEKFAPVLRILGLYEHFAEVSGIGLILQAEKPDEVLELANNCFAILERVGLCHFVRNSIYKLHPALRSCLIKHYPAEEADKRVFVDVMCCLVRYFLIEPLKPLREKQNVFSLFGANFYRALDIAREFNMREEVLCFNNGLAFYTYQVRNFAEAKYLYGELANTARIYSSEEYEAIAYRQLGVIAHECRDFNTAKKWYQKSLQILLKLNDEHSAAGIYHELGMVAFECRDFTAAEGWYHKSLEIKLRFNDEYGTAITYHELGLVASERCDFLTAEERYHNSLEIKLRLGYLHIAASTYHELGMIAQKSGDFLSAEEWYNKSLEISLRFNDRYLSGITYHELGMVAQKRHDFLTSEQWYKKSLEIFLKYDEHRAAITYHQLGLVASERRDFIAAAEMCQKSLEIKLRLGNEHGAAITYHQLGVIAHECHDYPTCEKWCYKSLEISLRFNNEYVAVINYDKLGDIAFELADFNTAEQWYLKALVTFEKFGNEHFVSMVKKKLERLEKSKTDTKYRR